MFLHDDVLPADYGTAIGTFFPGFEKKYETLGGSAVAATCGRFGEIYARLVELKRQHKALRWADYNKAAAIEYEAKKLIKLLEQEAANCNPATGATGTDYSRLAGFTRAGGGAARMGLRPAGPRAGGGMTLPGAGGAAQPVSTDPAAGEPAPTGMDTTTLLLLGGGALALFFMFKGKGKKKGGSVYAGRD